MHGKIYNSVVQPAVCTHVQCNGGNLLIIFVTQNKGPVRSGSCTGYF